MIRHIVSVENITLAMVKQDEKDRKMTQLYGLNGDAGKVTNSESPI